MRTDERGQAERTGDRLGPDLSGAPYKLYDVLLAVDARTERMERRLFELQEVVGSGIGLKEWFSTAEFAREVKKAEFTIRTACNKKRLMAEKTENGREWRIHRTELERYRKQGLLPTESVE